MNTFQSDLSQKEFPLSDRISAKSIRKPLLELIQKEHPTFEIGNCLSLTELNYYREKYISESLVSEIGEFTEIEKIVADTSPDKTILSSKLDDEKESKLSLGQRVADNMASFGGSWTFIISFGVFIFIWIILNIVWFANKGYDPYPFILLNLILSCIAAMQAPVIMMSQNRQEEKDRERAKMDYMVNLKSELEIRMLHEKLDHLVTHQQQELLEIQKIQIDMMNDILKGMNGGVRN
jgi:uncharacterized membrane protein